MKGQLLRFGSRNGADRDLTFAGSHPANHAQRGPKDIRKYQETLFTKLKYRPNNARLCWLKARKRKLLPHPFRIEHGADGVSGVRKCAKDTCRESLRPLPHG